SEYVDRDTAESIQTGRETLGVALSTAQERLQRVFVVFTLGLLVGVLGMRVWVWPELKEDLLVRGARVIAQTPFDVILLQVKIGFGVGLLAALIALAYYAKEPLTERGIVPESSWGRWQIAGVVVAALFLGLVGTVYGYYVFFPIVFAFLANNAMGAGLAPMYSIVHWTQFILILVISFALAAELPLAMSALSASGIVPYETFRDKWRYAIVLIFVFGAVASPPDPLTQLMWSLPLIVLYAFSLYVTRIVTVAARGRDEIAVAAILRARWNVLAGTAVAVGGLTYAVLQWGGTRLVDETLRPLLPAAIRPAPLPPVEAILGTSRPVAVGVVTVSAALLATLLVALVVSYRAFEAAATRAAAETTGPEDFDVSELSKEGVEAAPPAVFEEMSEEEAVELAREAMDEGRAEKAQSILDRYDDPQQTLEETPVEGETDEGDPFTSTAAGMVDAFTEEETTEDDIGGYWYDIRFIASSLRSRAFRIVAVFMLTLGGIFAFLYRGGIGTIRADFLSRIPPELRPSPAETQWPITLHPVEALIFEIKLATVIAGIVTLPVVFYYAWPALRTRGLIRGNRDVIAIWGVALIGGLIVGSVLGYRFVAPAIISYLVLDAIRAGMAISYRVNNFFWMVFMTTGGFGLLADVPISMVLFREGGLVRFETLYGRWRVIVFAIFVFSALVTPGSLYTMLLVAVPVSLAYLLGLGILWVVTLGGRRGGSAPADGAGEGETA
ncbi:MAG: twin-arginine translocase subunit TatC, partial [Halanaeroarchaeum sp.]